MLGAPQNLPQPIRQLNAHLPEKPTFQVEVCILVYVKRYVKMFFSVQDFPIRIGDLHPDVAGFFWPQEVLHAATFAINSAIAQEVPRKPANLRFGQF